MELNKQVVSLELAKKLKSLGVKQESLFVWLFRNYKLSNPPQENWDVELRQRYYKVGEQYSAFTVAELGEMLPRQICDQDQKLSGVKGKCYPLTATFLYDDYGNPSEINGFQLKYGDSNIKVCSDTSLNSAGIYYTGTEADARAKMLIYLIENKLITLNND